jgi:pentose-5-phosphate-3-epimerase
MNPFYMMNIIQQVRQIKQNPSQLATLLKQRGIVNDQQAKEIEKMGGNYEQIGQYLMNSGRMPSNVQQYEGQVEQVQNMLK